jgi:DNA polymerase-4/DNA polymerase V
MFAIVRRYTHLVEEYSIDECFAEITGLRKPLQGSYRDIAARIQQDLHHELGMTFSVGVAPSKVVAKIASDWQKPAGLTAIPGRELPAFLARVPVEDVWGIGPQTSARLHNCGIDTALAFARQSREWIVQHVTKPHREIWHELRGEAVLPLETEGRHDYKSISKVKTFTPPSCDRTHIRAQLSKNAENACIKARRYSLAARRIVFMLRRQDFTTRGYEVTLARPTNTPAEIMQAVDAHLDRLYRANTWYRTTGIVLADLCDARCQQADLFGEHQQTQRLQAVFDAVDHLSAKYGKHTVFLGSSFSAITDTQHAGDRGDAARRKEDLFKGENSRQRLGLPMLGDVA